MKELISEADMNSVVDYDLDEGCLEWGYLMNLRRMANQRHEEAMKERAIEFAEFWAAECNHLESYYLEAEEAYDETYGLSEQNN